MEFCQMSAEDLSSKYIASAEKVLNIMNRVQAPVTVDAECVEKLISYAMAYFEDAKYYKDKKKFETSLTSIAYCEGLLDALRLIGAVKFEWPRNTMIEK
jgi:FAD synthetase